MRSQFSKSVTDPRVILSEGTFDHTGVEDGWADLIVVAQVNARAVLKALSLTNECNLGVPLVPRP
jgi:hypothetical protein